MMMSNFIPSSNKQRIWFKIQLIVKLFGWKVHAAMKVKTWFQKYLQSLLGRERVIQLDLKNSMGNIMQILRKQSLSTLDTFMFNDVRSGLSETRCNNVLENIKDGCSIASKYSSEIIQFKTPHVVIVFSNADPDMTQ